MPPVQLLAPLTVSWPLPASVPADRVSALVLATVLNVTVAPDSSVVLTAYVTGALNVVVPEAISTVPTPLTDPLLRVWVPAPNSSVVPVATVNAALSVPPLDRRNRPLPTLTVPVLLTTTLRSLVPLPADLVSVPALLNCSAGPPWLAARV